MPLIVRDFTWEETEKCICVTVPLKGVKAEKVDILCSDEFVKVSYPPYLFECLLFAPVEEDSSTAKVGNGVVDFVFPKKELVLWGQLQSLDAADKEIMKVKREEALLKTQEKAEREKKQKAEDKKSREKFTLNEMMKLETAERTRIENEKKMNAKRQQRIWKGGKKSKSNWLNKRRDDCYRNRKQLRLQRNLTMRHANLKNERTEKIVVTRQIFSLWMDYPQERLWLRKQAEASRIMELEDKDLSEEEKNPIFLRDKGNSFFQSGNFLAAINAYSHAIRVSPKMPSLYSNRAACHLKLRNFFKSIEDSSKALELLDPPVPQNLASRCKAMIRRGTAFCQLELYVEGLQDYEAALKLDPSNAQVKEDADKIRQVIQSSSVES
ncbi:hypothetical protein ScPMuIL_017525 [Solemya velum]